SFLFLRIFTAILGAVFLFLPTSSAFSDEEHSHDRNGDPGNISLEALPVHLEAIKKIRVAGKDVAEKPMRVGNLDVLAPIVDFLPGLGATATLAAEANIPDLSGLPAAERPEKKEFFQLNFPAESGTPPLVFALGRSVAYVEKETYALRAAPMVL